MVSQRFFASLIGVIAIGLPAMLTIVAISTDCFYDSLSHNYYAKFFGDMFVVALSMIGVFLFAYRGSSFRDSMLANFAGLSALGIALFPTSGDGLLDQTCSGRAFFQVDGGSSFGPLFFLFPGADILHFGSATFLFGFLAYYSLFVFTQVHDSESVSSDGTHSRAKVLRNRMYVVSGLTIISCMALLAAYATFGASWLFWNQYNMTFWLEGLVLGAFGVSWIVKGRVFGNALQDDEAASSEADYSTVGSVQLLSMFTAIIGFLASSFGVYQAYVYFYPPSEAVKHFAGTLAYDEEAILAGANRDFGQFIRSNIGQRVFLRIDIPAGQGTFVADNLCGVEQALQPAKSELRGDYVIWHMRPEVPAYTNLEMFCRDVTSYNVEIEQTIFEIVEDAAQRSCGRVTLSTGGIQYVRHDVTGFYRVEKGLDWEALEHYRLIADIPEGKEYSDTLSEVGGC